MSTDSKENERALFCLIGNDMSGGTKVLRELMRLLKEDGYEIDLYLWDNRRNFNGWPELSVRTVDGLEQVGCIDYKYVFVPNLALFPVILPWIGSAIPIYLCMAYEKFHYGSTYEETRRESDTFLKILRLPRATISVSRALQALLEQRAQLSSYYIPHGIDRSLFYPRPRAAKSARKRILMVGSYLLPWKGIEDGCAALEILAQEIDLELILITQARSGRGRFSKYSYPVEFHYQPALAQIPEIYASCHAYCCPSWHEGFGLPVIEAFSCGVPVVSTKNDGATDHGVDETNLLFSEPNSPRDLASNLRRVLTDDELSAKLIEQGFVAAAPYDWEQTRLALRQALNDVSLLPRLQSTQRKDDMDRLSGQLEAEGLFTPLPVFSRIRSSVEQLESVCKSLASSEAPIADTMKELQVLYEETKPYLRNPDAEYFNSFRETANTCKMLLAIGEDRKSLSKAAACYIAQRNIDLSK